MPTALPFGFPVGVERVVVAGLLEELFGGLGHGDRAYWTNRAYACE